MRSIFWILFLLFSHSAYWGDSLQLAPSSESETGSRSTDFIEIVLSPVLVRYAPRLQGRFDREMDEFGWVNPVWQAPLLPHRYRVYWSGLASSEQASDFLKWASEHPLIESAQSSL